MMMSAVMAVIGMLVMIILGESEKGTNGVSTDGVAANFMFLTEGLFGYSR